MSEVGQSQLGAIAKPKLTSMGNLSGDLEEKVVLHLSRCAISVVGGHFAKWGDVPVEGAIVSLAP